MGTRTGRHRAAIGAALALLAGLGTMAATASPAAAATGDVLVLQKGSTGNLVTLQTFLFLPGITEQSDGVQAGATQFAVTNLTNGTLTLTEKTPAGAVLHSDSIAAGRSGTFAVTGGDTVALTVPSD
ncbi:hypothetical protein ACGFT2_33400 [Streptomyces sp. NPDC048514]|uniref:hypothetical protein n=1 Tax=Streptomyces sp. NPDC048514 TaxID=3365564 RepID=UPI00371B2418